MAADVGGLRVGEAKTYELYKQTHHYWTLSGGWYKNTDGGVNKVEAVTGVQAPGYIKLPNNDMIGNDRAYKWRLLPRDNTWMENRRGAMNGNGQQRPDTQAVVTAAEVNQRLETYFAGNGHNKVMVSNFKAANGWSPGIAIDVYSM